MTRFTLSGQERQALNHLIRHTHDATARRRAQALAWIAQGERAVQVALRLQVSRQVIYQWRDLFRADPSVDLATRLAAGARSGRPPTVQGVIDPLLDEVIDHDPPTFGYNSTVWTAPLLAEYLRQEHGVTPSVQSVRLAIARLEITWKRPRHRLALRPPTWRQAKGG